MKITALSLNIEWENKEANFAKVESLLSQLDEAGDVVILPEMFSTGFTMNKQLAEDAAGITLHWMLATAAKYNVALIGSFPYTQNGREMFNRAYFVKPDGTWEH